MGRLARFPKFAKSRHFERSGKGVALELPIPNSPASAGKPGEASGVAPQDGLPIVAPLNHILRQTGEGEVRQTRRKSRPLRLVSKIIQARFSVEQYQGV